MSLLSSISSLLGTDSATTNSIITQVVSAVVPGQPGASPTQTSTVVTGNSGVGANFQNAIGDYLPYALLAAGVFILYKIFR